MKKLLSSILITIIISTAYLNSTNAQIEIGVIGASTFCQINGDNAIGFNKIGFYAGLETNIMLGKRVGLTSGLQFAQKGSKIPKAFQSQSTLGVNVSLNYIQSPLFIRLQSDYGLYFIGGMTLGRLLNVHLYSFNEENVSFKEIETSFNPWEIGIQMSIGYRINNNLQIAGGWGQSVNNIFTEEISGKNGLQNQQFSIQCTYALYSSNK